MPIVRRLLFFGWEILEVIACFKECYKSDMNCVSSLGFKNVQSDWLWNFYLGLCATFPCILVWVNEKHLACVFRDELSNGWQLSLLNDEQMSNQMGGLSTNQTFLSTHQPQAARVSELAPLNLANSHSLYANPGKLSAAIRKSRFGSDEFPFQLTYFNFQGSVGCKFQHQQKPSIARLPVGCRRMPHEAGDWQLADGLLFKGAKA